MHDPCPCSSPCALHVAGQGHFEACVNGQPLQLVSLLGRLTLRPELSGMRSHWIWKIIAQGRVGRIRVSLGLFFEKNLQPGTYDLAVDRCVRVVYNEAPLSRNIIYHSQDLQNGTFTLLAADQQSGHLQGRFDFAIPAVAFEVSAGRFDLHCCRVSRATSPRSAGPKPPGTARGSGLRPSTA